MKQLLAAGALALFFLAGCNQSVVHRRDSMTSNTPGRPNGSFDLVSTDASQRIVAIRSMPAYKSDGTLVHPANGSTGPGPDPWIMCAEPSPDTMTSVTSSVAAALKNSHVSAEVAAAVASQAAMIGLRTQSITLLRDEAFRLCEGYLNQAIDKWMFTILHRRFQNLMIANLAIEQLTGYARPTTVAIGGTGTATAASNLLDTQAAYDQAVKDAAAAGDSAKAAKKAADDNDAIVKKDDQSTPEATAALNDAKGKQAGLASDLALAQQKKDNADANVESLRTLLDNARAPTATAAANTATSTAPPADAASTQIVAGAVERIVASSIDKDLTGDFCMDYFMSHGRGAVNSDNVYESCLLRLHQQQLKTMQLDKQLREAMRK